MDGFLGELYCNKISTYFQKDLVQPIQDGSEDAITGDQRGLADVFAVPSLTFRILYAFRGTNALSLVCLVLCKKLVHSSTRYDGSARPEPGQAKRPY
jgi:hypothetical protein